MTCALSLLPHRCMFDLSSCFLNDTFHPDSKWSCFQCKMLVIIRLIIRSCVFTVFFIVFPVTSGTEHSWPPASRMFFQTVIVPNTTDVLRCSSVVLMYMTDHIGAFSATVSLIETVGMSSSSWCYQVCHWCRFIFLTRKRLTFSACTFFLPHSVTHVHTVFLKLRLHLK